MTTANELITRSLRLLNVPGRGASLAAQDLSNALEALQELLDSEAVSKFFVPGIRRHFFQLDPAQSIYSYGAGAQFDLQSDAFGFFVGDVAPIHIEQAYVRQGSTITEHELVDEYRFYNEGTWDTQLGLEIRDNQLFVEQSTGEASQVLAPDLTGATTYTIRMTIAINMGTALVELRNNAVTFVSYTLDSSGDYEFDFVWPAGTLPDIFISSTDADDWSMTLCSILPRGVDRLTMPDGVGTDTHVRIIDQTTYNRFPVKGAGDPSLTGSRVYELLYSRSAGQAGELRLVSPGTSGDILVMDVLVNTVQVQKPSDTIGVNPEAIRWLRYALADNVSGEYGKSLNARQLKILEQAWNQLAASNRRTNMLGVDGGLRRRRLWSITTGDYR